jgi:hypothetical protein
MEELAKELNQPTVYWLQVPEKGMSLQIDKLLEALSVAQGQMESASKGSDNPFFKSKYADLNEYIQTAKKPLADNGLSVIQLTDRSETKAKVTTILGHKSGQWISTTLELAPTKPDAQGMGSAITYARRYGYGAILGMGAEDDDGNEASKASKPTAEVKEKAQQATVSTGATQAQKDMIVKQLQEKGKTETDVTNLFQKELNKMSIAEASKVINWLLGLPK